MCDEQESLTASGGSISIDEAIDRIERYPCEWVHITGGEPLEHKQDLAKLLLASRDHRVQIQTSGLCSFDFKASVFMTCLAYA